MEKNFTGGSKGRSLIPYPSQYYRHVSSKHHYLDLKLKEVFRYRDLISLTVKRSFVTSYKQTVLGPLWLLINPLLTAIMRVVMFGNIAKLSTDGIPAILFHLSGTALWGLFSSCLSNNSSVFISNAHLFGKVYFPRLTMPISSVIVTIIRFSIEMLLMAVLMVYFGVTGMVSVNWAGLWMIPLLVVQLSLLGLGIGLLVTSVTTKYRDLSVLVSFGLSLWMYATPVVYPLSQLSDGWLKRLILLNPLTPSMEMFRWALFGKGSLMWGAWLVTLAVTAMILLLGIIVFNKVERKFLDTV